MHKEGLSRPGALEMFTSSMLLISAVVFPLAFCSVIPEHEWLLSLTGIPALMAMIAIFSLTVFFCFGFFQYSHSKGYGNVLTLILLLGNLPGFVVLLLLPDLKAKAQTAQLP